MNITILGEVRAWDDAGTALDLGPPKCRVVLAALALSPGSAVPVTRLVDLVWGEDAPRTADKTLQSYVTRLRKALGHDTIVRSGAAYRLHVPGDAVDVGRFESRLAAGDVAGALAQWGGPPLAGLEVGGLDAVIDGLVESWLGAVEQDLARRVGVGDAGAVGELAALTSANPFREGLWALLMIALYRSGRQADALAAYGRCRAGLVDGLGVEPGPALRALEAAVLAQDDDAVVAAIPAGPGGGPPGDGPPTARSAVSAPGSVGVGVGPATGPRPTGTVTFGMCEVVDADRLWAERQMSLSEDLARLDDRVRTAAAAYDGVVFSVAGDGFGVAFHRPSDAVAWAVAVTADRGPDPSEDGHADGADRPNLSVRSGIHTGETDEHDGGYFGPAVILAGRLASVANAGQVLVSGVSAELLADQALTELGTFRLDGVVADQRILQLGPQPFPPLRVDGPGRGNLPRRADRLIGRDDELAAIVAAVEEEALVTLVGPGGIGKTSLAVAAARQLESRFPGGTWLIELAGVSADAGTDEGIGAVARAVVDALNLTDRVGREPLELVVGALATRRVLLVLDNCEHVVGGAAAVAEDITAACPDTRILATSREGLGAIGEQLIPIGPLDPAGAAVELFHRRAGRLGTGPDTGASAGAVEEICRRLDGVPLAIELAAARTTTLTPADLVSRLDDRLRLLTGGRRTTMERHRTLRATIQWSYDLLDRDEQRLFRRLAVFAGPFDLHAAILVGDGDGVDALLGGLVDRSMVIVESGPFGRRFRLLETMRDFGFEHLGEAGETDAVAARHAEWCATEVAAVRTQLAGHDEVDGVARLDELWSNLRSAVTWALAVGDAALVHRLTAPIATELYVRNRNEIGRWAEGLLEIAPPERDDLVTFGVIWALRRHMRNRDPNGYARLVERYGEPDHPQVRYGRAFVTGDVEDRLVSAPLVVDRLLEDGDHYGAALFDVVGVGLSLLLAGRFVEAEQHLEPLVERHRRDGPPTCENWTLTYLGIAVAAQGRPEEAERWFQDAIEVELPLRTTTWNEPLAARAAAGRGRWREAFLLLADHLDSVIEGESYHTAALAAGEYIDLVARAGEQEAVAEGLTALDGIGLLDGLTVGTGLRAADEAIAAYRADRPGANAADAAVAAGDGPGPANDAIRPVLVAMADSLRRLAG
ncbi:MAG: BTAD domain-containing putative transcriptional regulator [Actinomycetota bacterium]